MPSKFCPICGDSTILVGSDWGLISRLDNVVCSRKCAFDFIETRPSPSGYLHDAMQMKMGQPDACYSDKLGMFFRSKYEQYVAEAFKENGIIFEYEKYAFPVKQNAYYCPDFHLPGCRMFVEVKGAWGASAKSKITSFAKKYPNVTLLLLPWTIHGEFYL